MALQEISTGYKPEFSLGALYQGYNAGNAMNAAELANLKAEEELQYDRLNNPMRLIGANRDAAEAQGQLDDPNYLPWKRAGYTGQMQMQEAQGRKAQALSADDIAAGKQDLQNKLISGQLDYKTYQEQKRMFDQLESGAPSPQQGTGQIGFGMQPEPQSNFNTNYGNEGRGLTPLPILKNEAAMKASMGNDYVTGDRAYDLETLDKEIRQFGDKSGELGKERARLVASLANGGGTPVPLPNMPASSITNQAPVFSNMSSGTLGNKPTPYSDLIPKSSLLAKMAGIRALTPEFVAKSAQGEQKADSAEDIALSRQNALADRAKKEMAAPKYNEQLAAAFRTKANPNASPQEKYEADMFIHLDTQRRIAANPGAYAPRMDLGSYGVPMQTAPVTQAQQTAPQAPSNTPPTPPGAPAALPPGVTRK